jgi:hypothetical protein
VFGLFKKAAGPPKGPDFSAVDSPEKAKALVAQGQLEPMLLFPACFGGDQIPHNTIYVPVGLGEIRDITDRVIAQGVEGGRFTDYVATPRYVGRSVVPVSLSIEATGTQSFGGVLKIWGDGLAD